MQYKPANQNTIWPKLIVTVDVPHVVWSGTCVCPALKPMLPSVNDTNRIHLPQHQPHGFLRHNNSVLLSQKSPHGTISAKSTCILHITIALNS